jgi:hypothetical protein
MDKGELYLDDKAQLVPQNLRSLFVQVADYYSRNGKMDTAVAVLDKCYTVMPESILPMRLNVKALSADIYYRAGLTEKADVITTEIGDRAYEMANYYGKFDVKGIQSLARDRQDNLDILRNVGALTREYKRDELNKKYTDLYAEASRVY